MGEWPLGRPRHFYNDDFVRRRPVCEATSRWRAPALNVIWVAGKEGESSPMRVVDVRAYPEYPNRDQAQWPRLDFLKVAQELEEAVRSGGDWTNQMAPVLKCLGVKEAAS